MKMKVLVLGQGGREHAIAWKLSRSPKIEKVFICPGNGGTALEKNIENVDLSIDDSDLLINFTKKENIDITIVGSGLYGADDIPKRYRSLINNE